ncbi:hypothetical protein HJG60_009141 [Phyllostomus discolor]|uniref:Uncharacterized protein n=1 Tax=Phyllostomus discolor TaxID=89673 RepID=A0A833YPX8_9CHIR|nr:hypothetical protein HJG60_009141 [Phyllostomus discolor]
MGRGGLLKAETSSPVKTPGKRNLGTPPKRRGEGTWKGRGVASGEKSCLPLLHRRLLVSCEWGTRIPWMLGLCGRQEHADDLSDRRERGPRSGPLRSPPGLGQAVGRLAERQANPGPPRPHGKQKPGAREQQEVPGAETRTPDGPSPASESPSTRRPRGCRRAPQDLR